MKRRAPGPGAGPYFKKVKVSDARPPAAGSPVTSPYFKKAEPVGKITPPSTAEIDALSESQRKAYKLAVAGKSVVIMGSAGAGKTHVLSLIIRNIFSRPRISGRITAMTGRAAENLSTSVAASGSEPPIIGTFHSLFGLQGIPADATAHVLYNMIKDLDSGERKLRGLTSMKVLIIDEVSMLSAHIFQALDYLLRYVKRYDSPFGGVQVIFAGDFFQLPPVVGKDPPRAEKPEWALRSAPTPDYGRLDPTIPTTAFCFQAPSWGATFAMDNVVTLLTIFRQRDARFQQFLDNLKFGALDDSDHEFLADLAKKPIPVIEETSDPSANRPAILYPHRSNVQDMNERLLHDLDPANPGTSYKVRPDIPAGSRLELARVVTLKPGAVVRFVKNTNLFKNGTLGMVEGFTENRIEQLPMVRLYSTGQVITVSREPFEDFEGNVYHQIPLVLCFACTMHQVQGMTLDYVYANFERGHFESQQPYVALSRATSAANLYVRGLDPATVKPHPVVVEFYARYGMTHPKIRK